jgi:hypothetical protein
MYRAMKFIEIELRVESGELEWRVESGEWRVIVEN